MLERVSLYSAWTAVVAIVLLCCLWPAGLLPKPALSIVQGYRVQEDPHAPAALAPASLQLPLLPQAAWLSQCCLSKKLRELYLPGSHDSGTGHPWTLPHRLPFVFDEVAAVLFNIVGDLSRTQHHTVYEQLQAGVRVLDLRLAVNPWIALEQRAKAISNNSANSSSNCTRSSSLWKVSVLDHEQAQKPSGPLQDCQPATFFTVDAETWQGSINYTTAGGPLTAAELAGAVVISHSLPGVKLTELLGDVRKFLAEQPTEVVTVLVKGDTVDVNVAASHRMSQAAWSAAADSFRQELPGVQLLTQEQVEQQTLAELVVTGPLGSVLVYSSELQQAGLTALSSRQLEILESWGNGTDTEDVPTLKDKIISWMHFWHDAGWRQNDKPYMLLASAEVTLGVKTILQLLKNRMWLAQQQQDCASHTRGEFVAALDDLQPHKQKPQPHARPAHCRQLKRPGYWHQLLCQWMQQHDHVQQQQQQQAGFDLLRGFCCEAGPRLSVMRTLYDLGVAANQQLLQEVLLNEKVLKAFNIWSLDAVSSDIVEYVIQLNAAPASS